MAYNKNTDYQKLIDEAVANKNFSAAAQYEAQRNQKINDMNAAGTNTGGYQTTDLYSKYLTGSSSGIGVYTDEQQKIKDQMNQNSLQWWNADDATKQQLEAQNQQLAAQLGGSVKYDPSTGAWGGNADTAFSGAFADQMAGTLRPGYENTAGEKPTYNDQYGDQIDALLQQILGREQFSYDPNTDPLFQSYKAQYNREGTRAMQDTLASMASGAGGMNTWAVSAAQQANDYHQSQLADKIPELYQLAYSMYLDDRSADVENLGLLMGMEDNDYSKYRDQVSDYLNDRDFDYGQYRDQMADYYKDVDFAYGQHRDQIADKRYDKEWEYGVSRDQIADKRYDKEWEYGIGRDQLEDSRYDSEMAYAKAMDFLTKGVMPDDATLQAAGIDPTMAAALVAVLGTTATTSANGNGGNGGGGGGGGGDPTYDDGLGDDPSIDWNSVTDLGLGMHDEAWLEEMTAREFLDVTETADGKLAFTLTDLGKVMLADQNRGYDIGTGKNNNYVPPVGSPADQKINALATPAPGPEPKPTPTPAPNNAVLGDLTGTAGVGTAVEWIMNQIMKRNK